MTLIDEIKRAALDAGMSGNHWYAVEKLSVLRRKRLLRVVFWGTPIALFADEEGQVHAVEDRCAHRHISLAEHGCVRGQRLVCGYHGWEYRGDGACERIPYDNHRMTEALRPRSIRIRSYPVRAKYGLVWIFPGDAALAEATPLPAVQRLDGPDAVPVTLIDEHFLAHHELVIENFLDLYHEFLHRRFSPFAESVLEDYRRDEASFTVAYSTKFAKGLVLKHFLPGFKPTTRVQLEWRYPYLFLDFEGLQQLWLFFCPAGPAHTRVLGFFVSQFLVPGLNRPMPRWMAKATTQLFTWLYSATFTREDRVILQHEHEVAHRHAHTPGVEINPVVTALRQFTIDKWEAYRTSELARMATLANDRERVVSLGAGLTLAEVSRPAAATRLDLAASPAPAASRGLRMRR